LARPAPPPTADELVRLFQEHADGLAAAVRGVLGSAADVQELLQEAFLRATRALARGARPAAPVAWVFVLVIHLARDQRRAAQRRGRTMTLDEGDPMQSVRLEADEPGPAAGVLREEALHAARAAVLALDEAEKEVFLLRVTGELSFDAIASALDIPVGTAKTRMRAALARLRRRLAPFAPEGTGNVDGKRAIELRGDVR